MKVFDPFLTSIRNRPLTSLMALVSVLLAGTVGAFVQGKHTALERLEFQLDQINVSRKNLLQREFQNPLLAPKVLATSKTMRELLIKPSLIAAREQNEILEETAGNIQVDAIFVLNLSGNCVAASNWRQQDSGIGKNFSFRPYFQQVLAGQTGRYIAKGFTMSKTGYYLALPVNIDGKIRGVVVEKISFDALHRRVNDFWRDNKELDLVADENGVVIVSSLSNFEFKSIHPISDSTRKVINTSHQYGTEILPIPSAYGDVLDEQVRFVNFIDIPDQSFLQKSYYYDDLGLRLYLNLPASSYWKIVTSFTAFSSLLALVILLVVLSIFQRWVYRTKLMEAAIRDPLTGLNTRLYMDDWYEAAIRAHNRNPSAGFGFVLLDLDLFKQVNDVYGHLTGDEVLRRVGEIVRNAIRGNDLAVRFGGEELAVFVQCTDLAEATSLAERIRYSVEQFEFMGKTGRVPVTLSGGVAFHETNETFESLFSRADKKVYEAKELGRNRIRS